MKAPSVLSLVSAMHRSSVWFLVLSCWLAAVSQTTPDPADHSFTVSASQLWTDTHLDFSASDTLSLTAQAAPESDSSCTPQGTATGPSEQLPLASAPAGALMAKTSENGEASLVGASHELRAETAGHLFLGINRATKSNCTFSVSVKVTHAENSSSTQPRNVRDQLSSAAKVWMQGQFGGDSPKNSQSSAAVAGNGAATATASGNTSGGLKLPTVTLDADLRGHVDELPRRVHDHAGNLGDMVHFVIVGSQDRAQAALEAADWHVADVDSKEAGLKAVLNTYEKKDYLEMPMSHLYLFDRMQDFGYEQAQAYAVVASRHHFRLWKAPFTCNGETIWVGAGTHDVGFEKDIRTGKLTHKIDPEVDGERENIAQSLEKSGKVKSMTYYLPPSPVQDAKNASGGGYHSDGRLLVVFLK